VGVLAAAFRALEDSGNLAKIKNLFILIGPRVLPGSEEINPLLVGNCVKKYRSEGNFVPGCPPPSWLVRESIEKIYLSS